MSFFNDNSNFKWLCIFAGLMCLIDIIPMPLNSLKVATNWIIFFISLWIALIARDNKEYLLSLLFIGISLVFNPFVLLVKINIIRQMLLFICSILFFTVSVRLKLVPKFSMIDDEQAEEIREKYQKAEQMYYDAQKEKEKAKDERVRMEQARRRAEEEWERIKNQQKISDDPYVILGVHKTDSIETIKDVYRKLALLYHPDHYSNCDNLSRTQKNELMKKINLSYEWILKHHQ